MNPDVLVPLIPIVAIVAIAAVKIARVRATRPESQSTDVTERFEALERVVQDLQHELTETQERLDFAERLLGKAREERRIGSERNCIVDVSCLLGHGSSLMAAGPLPLGIAAFAAVKLAGYTLAGRTLNRANHVTRPRPLAFGAARTLHGIIAGVSYATMLGKFGVNRSEVWYYVNLPELRLSIRTSRGRIEYEGGEILRAFKKLSRFAYTLDIE